MKHIHDYTDEEFNNLFNEEYTYELIIDVLIDKGYKLVQGSDLHWKKGKISIFLEDIIRVEKDADKFIYSSEFTTPNDFYSWLKR